ncbi:MAG: peptidylprolyl isomerase [Candidatus Dasytiphilus stammeri]
MNISLKISRYLFYILLIFFNSTVSKASTVPVIIDTIALRINNNILLTSEIDFIKRENFNPFLDKFIPNDKLIKQIILKNILFKIGKKQKISVTKRQIYHRMILHLKNMADRKHLTLYQFYHDVFAQCKWKYHLLYQQILQNLMIQSVIKNHLKNDIFITPNEITQQIKNQTNNSYYYYKYPPKIFITEMHVRDILLAPTKNNKKKMLNNFFLEEMNHRKKNFYIAATQQSSYQDFISVWKRDLGWITPDMLGEPLGFVLLNLNKNEISPPVFYNNHWHLIQLQKTRKTNYTNILLKERALILLYQIKWNLAIQPWIRNKVEQAFIKILDPKFNGFY